MENGLNQNLEALVYGNRSETPKKTQNALFGRIFLIQCIKNFFKP